MLGYVRARSAAIMCPSMRNPSGGAPSRTRARSAQRIDVSIDEKPVRRCASHAAKSLKHK